MKSTLLDFVAVGPQKTGTTWLYEVLKNHPKIAFPNDVKETMFFDLNYDKGAQWYISHFLNDDANKICGEIGPSYFDVEYIPERIYSFNPNCKIIITLRDPISRALSLYRHHWARGRVKGSFQEAVEQMPRILTAGDYAQHIPRWLDLFGEENILILFFDDLTVNPQQIVDDVCSFLEIDKKVVISGKKTRKVNAAKSYRLRWLASWSTSLSLKLHSLRLHKLINIFKALGLKSLVYKQSGENLNLPYMTFEEKCWVLDKSLAGIEYIECLTGRELASWKSLV